MSCVLWFLFLQLASICRAEMCFNLKFPSFVSFSFSLLLLFLWHKAFIIVTLLFSFPTSFFSFLKPWEADPLVNVLCHRPIYAVLKVLLFWSILPNPSCLILFSLPFLMSFQVVPPLLISAPPFSLLIFLLSNLLNQINSSKLISMGEAWEIGKVVEKSTFWVIWILMLSWHSFWKC